MRTVRSEQKVSLPYCGHRNEGPPESIPGASDKCTRKLFTVPVRILCIPEIKETNR